MALVSEAELLARYNYFNTMSSTNITDDLIYYAEAEINARLSSAFDTPFTAGHPTVKDLIIDLAYAKGGKVADRAGLRKEVYARIEDIKKGNEYIYTGSGTTIAPLSGTDRVWSNTKGYHPTHSMLDAEDSMVSSSRIEDLEDARGI